MQSLHPEGQNQQLLLAAQGLIVGCYGLISLKS